MCCGRSQVRNEDQRSKKNESYRMRIKNETCIIRIQYFAAKSGEIEGRNGGENFSVI